MSVNPIPSAPDMAASTPEGTAQLRRTLSQRDLIAYGLAYIAPVAPFSTLGFVWDAAGGLIALAYLIGALFMYFTARSYAEMAAEVPSAGSVYGFARHSLGVLPGFIAGWMVLLDYLLIPSLVFLLMSVGMTILIPQIGRAEWLVLLVAVSLAINWFGVTVTSRVSMASALAQFAIVAAVLALAVWALYSGNQGTGMLSAKPFYDAAAFDWHKVFAATSICVLSFLGFDAISTLSEEVKDTDRRVVGRAILSVLLICGVLFVVTAWVLGNLMQGLQVRDPATAIFELLGERVSPWTAVALAWLMAIIVGFTNALPMQVGVARILFAMGRDRQLPVILARLHARNGTPHVAMVASTLLSLVVALVLRDHIETLASLVSFGALSAFVLLHLSVLVHWHKRPAQRRWFAHVAAPVLGVAVVLAVIYGMQSLALQVGAAWLVIGLLYGLWLRRMKRAELKV